MTVRASVIPPPSGKRTALRSGWRTSRGLLVDMARSVTRQSLLLLKYWQKRGLRAGLFGRKIPCYSTRPDRQVSPLGAPRGSHASPVSFPETRKRGKVVGGKSQPFAGYGLKLAEYLAKPLAILARRQTTLATDHPDADGPIRREAPPRGCAKLASATQLVRAGVATR